MVDVARVRRKVADIRAALAALRALAGRSEEAFASEDIVASAAKYKLLVAIEAALDLCNHLCARVLAKAPESYADCFHLLADGGILSGETAQRLATMARFRNLLVRQYAEVDDRRVHRILRENLGDLESYLSEVGRYLGQELQRGARRPMRRYLEASPPRRQAIRERITGILRARPEILGAFLFGSFVEERPFRDVDLGVLVDPGRVPESAAPGFASALASELEWETRVPVDLTVLNYASIGLRYHASRGEVIVCRAPERCNQFREQAWREYLDFEPFLRTSLRDLLLAEHSRPARPPVDPAASAVRGIRPEGRARSKS